MSSASAARTIVISLDGYPRPIVVDTTLYELVDLRVPLEGVRLVAVGTDLILHCPDGTIIRLEGVLLEDGPRVRLLDGTELLTPSELMDALGTDGWGGKTFSKLEDRGEGEGYDRESHGPPTPPQRSSSSSGSSSSSADGSGVGEYNADAGRGINGVNKMGPRPTDGWQGGSSNKDRQDGYRPSGDSGPAGPGTLRIGISQLDGENYPAEHIVLESDPFGMRLSLHLSRPADGGTALLDISGGTAVMASADGQVPGDYSHWSSWSIVLPDGRSIPAASCVSEDPAGGLLIVLPPGVSDFEIRIPLADNDSNNPDRSFVYRLSDAQGYLTEGELSGSILIVDDQRIQDIDPDWLPPVPGVLPPDYVGPTGPVANIVVVGGSDPHAAVTAENGPLVHYEFRLENLAKGGAHTPGEDIEVVLRLRGGEGMVLFGDDADITFDFSAFAEQFPDFIHDGAKGELRFTIPAGWTGGSVAFSGTPTPDTNIEALRESLRIEVVKAEGDEAVRGSGVSTEILEIPVISVSIDSPWIAESADHPDYPSTVEITFNLSSPALTDIHAPVNWLHGGGLTPGDYIVQGLPGGLPSTIFFPRGSTSVTLRVSAVDDGVAEFLETLGVVILPEQGVAAPSDNYRLGEDSSASLSFVDSGEVPPPPPPEARLVFTDASGQPLLDASGNYLSERHSMEYGPDGTSPNQIYYRIILTDHEGNPYTAPLDTNIEVMIRGLHPGVIIGEGPGWDLAFPGFERQGDGTLLLVVPGGESASGVFSALLNPDGDVTERGEGISLDISSIHNGFGLVAGPGLTDHIVEIPVPELSVGADHYSESGDPIAYTLSFSDVFLEETVVRLQFSGVAELDGKGADVLLSGLTVTGPHGEELVWSQDPKDPSIIEILMPPGLKSADISLPVVDDYFSERNESLKLVVLAPEEPDAYKLSSDASRHSATTTIVDDTRSWDASWGEQPAEHGSLDGPIARLVFTDASGKPILNAAGTDFATASELPESAGSVYYKVVLIDPAGPSFNSLYQAAEDVSVTIRAEGFGPSSVLDFGSSPADWDARFPGFDTSGRLTLVIGRGQSESGLNSARINQDLRSPEQDGGFTLSVVKASGNEAVASDQDLSQTILDIPLVSVDIDKAWYSESEGFIRCDLSLTESFAVDTEVRLQLPTPANSSTGAVPDLDVLTSGLTDADGNPLHYTVDTSDPAGPILILTVPAGTKDFGFRVPIVDDNLSENNESFTVTLLPPADAPLYHVDPDPAKSTADTIIVDDSKSWQDAYGDKPAEHGSKDGPIARLVFTDASGDPILNAAGTNFATASELPESAGNVYYKVVLIDPAGPAFNSYYQADEDISVTIRAEGFGPSSVLDFGSFPADWDARFSGFDSKGRLTLVIGRGQSESGVQNAQINQDLRSPEQDEGFTLSVVKASGNEAVASDQDLSQTILDIPLVSVDIDKAWYSESEGFIRCDLSLTESFAVDTEVRLQLPVPANASTGAVPDLDVLTSGLTDADGNPLQYTLDTSSPAGPILIITVPAGTKDFGFRVPIVDDNLSENNESFTVTLLPPAGAPLYHVDPDPAGSTADTIIVDDSKSWQNSYGEKPAEHGSKDGPIARLVFTDASGEPILNAAGTDFATASELPESAGNVYYKVVLIDPAGPSFNSYYQADEAVSVTILAKGFGPSSVLDFGSFPAGWDARFTGFDTNGKLLLTIGQGQSASGVQSALISQDLRSPEQGEGFTLSVVKASGNEALASDQDLSQTILDIPLASVSVDKEYYSESEGFIRCELSLSEVARQDTEVSLLFPKASNASDATPDLDFLTSGITDDQGNPLLVSVTSRPEGIVVVIKVPAGSSGPVGFRVPIVDDDLSENNETFTVTVISPGGTPLYHVNPDPAKNTANTVIVDDSKSWQSSYGNEPTGHGELDGPIVRLIFVDASGNPVMNAAGTDFATARDVQEYAGTVRYQVLLLDENGDPYTAREQITVTLGLEALNADTVIGKGSNLSPTDWDISYGDFDDAGRWTFTLNAGATQSPVFTAGLNADLLDESDEGVRLKVVSASGNEAVPSGQHLSEYILDTPLLSISIEEPYYSESEDFLVCTLDLSDRFGEATDVRVQLPKPVGAGAMPDLDVLTSGLKDADGNPLNYTLDTSNPAGPILVIRVPAGVESYSFRLPIADDALTENNETFTVTLLPPVGNPVYKLDAAPGSDTDTTVIVDDTEDWQVGYGDEPAGHGELDGPLVRLVFTDAAGNPLLNAEGTDFATARDVQEYAGVVHYKVLLLDPEGDFDTLYTAQQAISVTISVAGLDANSLIGNGVDALPPDWDMNFSGFGSGGVLTLTLNPGDTASPTFSALVHNDSLVESGEGVVLSIDSVSGNEATASDQDLTEHLLDTPVGGISIAEDYYAESEGYFVCDLAFSERFAQATEVRVQFPTPSSSLTGAVPGVDFLPNGLTDGQGNPLTYSVDMSAPGGPVVTITVPGGVKDFSFRVPIVDDALTEQNETLNVKLLPPGSGGLYTVDPVRESDSSFIVDDTKVWEPPFGEEPSARGLDGPLVRLVFTDASGTPLLNADGTDFATARDVRESDGTVYYKVLLLDPEGPSFNSPYSALENITVSLKVEGLGPDALLIGSGAVEGNYPAGWDIAFTGATNGELSVSIATGQNGSALIPARINNDAVDEADESLRLSITGATGNEAVVVDTPLVETVKDTPLASLTIDRPAYSENEDHIDCTLSFSDALREETVVRIKVPAPTDPAQQAEQGKDFGLVLKGPNGEDLSAYYQLDITDPANPVIVLTLPAGTQEFHFTLPLHEDALTENNESLRLELLEPNAPARYHVDSGNASTLIVDDTKAWDEVAWGTTPSGHPSLDGPLVRLVFTDASGTPLLNAAGTDFATERDVWEYEGTVYYKVLLLKPGGAFNELYDPADLKQAVTVTVAVEGYGPDAAVVGSGAQAGYPGNWDVGFAGASGGQLSVTINPGQNGSALIPAKINNDAVDEADESLRLSITGATGNEAVVVDTSLVETVKDTPLASLFIDRPAYSESESHIECRLSFSDTLREATEVRIKVPAAGNESLNAALNKDFTLTLVGEDGLPLNYTLDTSDPANPIIVLTVPPGSKNFIVKVPIIDDDLTENNEDFRLELLGPDSSGPAAYHVVPGAQDASTLIVDDSKAWDGGASWGGTPSDHGSLDGPVARLVFTDKNGNPLLNSEGTDYASARDVREYDGEVHYKVLLLKPGGAFNELYDTADLKQAVTVTVTVEGYGPDAAVIGSGAQAGYPANWDVGFTGASGGQISVVIGPGQNSSALIPGAIRNDTTDENDESLRLSITGATGNEAVYDTTPLIETIKDTPLASLFIDREAYSESESHIECRLSFSDTLREDTVVRIKVPAALNESLDAALDKDFTLTLVGEDGLPLNYTLDKTDPANPIIVLTVPSGSKNFIVKVPIADDALDENNESFRLELLGPAASGPAAYHVVSGAKDASTLIVDDSKSWNEGTWGTTPSVHGDKDGPVARLVFTDASGNPLLNSEGTDFATERDIREYAGEVCYKVVLIHPDGPALNYWTAEQPVSVTVKVEGYGSDAALTGSGALESAYPADWDIAFTGATGGELTLNIAKGQSASGVFKAKVNKDRNSPEEDESLILKVTGVSGNEAVASDKHLVETIIDTPLLSISVGAPAYSESPLPGEANTLMEFSLHLSKSLEAAAEAGLRFSGDAERLKDYALNVPGGSGQPGIVLSIDGVEVSGAVRVVGDTLYLTLPAGTGPSSNITFTVPILDDSLDEALEGVTVTVLDAANGTSYLAHADADKKSASTTIVDDTKLWDDPDWGTEPSGHGTLEGPKAAIYFKNSTSLTDPDDDRTGVVDESTSLTEYSVDYVVKLVTDAGQPFTGVTEQPTVIVIDPGAIGGSECGGITPGTGDYYFDVADFGTVNPGCSAVWQDGKLVITLAPGTNEATLTVTTVDDRNTEVGRYRYDDNGNYVDEQGNILPEGADPVYEQEDEAYRLTIVEVSGNEASVHDQLCEVSTSILEEMEGLQVGIRTVSTGPVEEGGQIEFELSFSQTPKEPVLVVLGPKINDPLGPTDADADDFDGSVLKFLVDPADIVDNKIRIRVDVGNDIKTEPTETVVMEIRNVIGSEATIDESRRTATAYIKDDNNGPLVNIYADGSVKGDPPGVVTEQDNGNWAYPEDAGRPVYTVTLSAPAGYPDNHTPVEAMTVTIKLGSGTAELGKDMQWGNLADIMLPKPSGYTGDWPSVVKVEGDTLTVRIPAGFTGLNNSHSFSISAAIIDDSSSEEREDYTVSIDTVSGSEGGVGPDKSVTTVIIDDTERVTAGDYPETALEGPLVRIEGTRYVSESGGEALYRISLVDKNGQVFFAEEPITITLDFPQPAIPGDTDAIYMRDFALPGSITVTIQPGASSIDVPVRIVDDAFSEKNEDFQIAIIEVSGNESRIDSAHDTVSTTIVDDTQPWLDSYGTHDGFLVINPEKAGSDPQDPSYVHDSKGAALEGPLVSFTLSGTSTVQEGTATQVQYSLVFSSKPTEDVSVVLRLAASTEQDRDGFTIGDLIDVRGKTADQQLQELTDKLTSMNSAGRNFQVSLDGSDILISLVVTKEESGAVINVPIFNDHLSEGSENFIVSVDSLYGGEAVINEAKSSATTTITDEGKGFLVGVTAWDPDAGSGGTSGLWVKNSTLPTKADQSEEDPNFTFKLKLTPPDASYSGAVEDMSVDIHLTGATVGSVVSIYTGDGTLYEQVTLDSSLRFTVNIPKDETNMSFSVPRQTGSGGKYKSEYLNATIEASEGCESLTDTGAVYATVRYQTGGDGPWTSISLVQNGSNHDPAYNNIVNYYQDNADNFTQEGSAAQYRLTFGGTLHDGKSNPSTPADGKLDYDITVTVKLKGLGGKPLSLSEDLGPNFLNEVIAANGGGTGDLQGFSWNAATGELTFTIKQNTVYGGGVGLNIPIATDTKVEGMEFYSIELVSANQSAYVYKTPVSTGVVDTTQAPTISISHADNNAYAADPNDFIDRSGAANTDKVAEGTYKLFYLELDEAVTDPFTVSFTYNKDGTDSAIPVTDYTADPTSIWFEQGTNGPGWVMLTVPDGGGGTKTIYRYTVEVFVPDDQFSEDNADFSIVIGVGDGDGVVADTTPVTTIIVDDHDQESLRDGPEVFIVENSMNVIEGDKTLFDIHLSKPPVEAVTVWIEILNYTTDDLGNKTYSYDFSKLDGLSGRPEFIDPGASGDGKAYIKVTVPEKMAQFTVELEDLILNDTLTQPTDAQGDPIKEKLELSIVKVEGAEAGVDPTRKDLTISVEDKLDGPAIEISINESTLYEGSTDVAFPLDATISFALPQSFVDVYGSAQQDITMTCLIAARDATMDRVLEPDMTVLQLVSDVGGVKTYTKLADPSFILTQDADGFHFTALIPELGVDARYTLADLGLKLVDDNWDDSAGKGFVISVESLFGNEAQLPVDNALEVAVKDDDHTPVTQNEKIVLMVDPAAKTGHVDLEVLFNDTDEDGQTLKVSNVSGSANYGSTYTVEVGTSNGEAWLSYDLDPSNPTIGVITDGQSFDENSLTYTVSDGWNTSTGKADLLISAGLSYTGKNYEEHIFGSENNDTVTVHSHGLSSIRGGEGDDVFVLGKAVGTVSLADYVKDFTYEKSGAAGHGLLDGGDGEDLIKLSNGNGVTLDMSGDPTAWQSKIKSVEALDISSKEGGTGNNIRIGDAAVSAFDSGSAVLKLIGREGDKVYFTEGEGWVQTAPANSDGFVLFTSTTGEQLLIDQRLSIVLNFDDTSQNNIDYRDKSNPYIIDAGGGDDTLHIHAKDSLSGGLGDDVFILSGDNRSFSQADDFGLIKGGGGTDSLKLAGKGNTLDLTGMTLVGRFESIEVIDISTSTPAEGNTVRVDASLIPAGETVTINGTVDDNYILSGSGWSYSHAEGGTHYVFTNGDRTLKVSMNMDRLVEGTDTADRLEAFTPKDVITAGDGNDTIVLRPSIGTGDDTITLSELPLVKGGNGTDLLQLEGAGVTLDLSGTNPGNRLESVEAIDLSTSTPGTGNLLIFNEALVPSGGSFTVSGSADDSISLSSDWAWQSSSGGQHIFTQGDRTLLVSEDMSLIIRGTAGNDSIDLFSAKDSVDALGGNDIIVLHDSLADSSGLITLTDLPSIQGGAGTGDALHLSGSGLTLDLSGGNPTDKLKGMEAIDISTSTTGAGNSLIFNDALVPAGGNFSIRGTGDDSLCLSSDWVWQSSTADEHILSNGTKQLFVDKELCLVITGTSLDDSIDLFSAKDSVDALAGNDTIVLHDSLATGGLISLSDLPSIEGGEGSDLLKLSGSGLTLDLRGADAASRVKGMEAIDISTTTPGSGNSLIFNDALVPAYGSVSISGTGDDSLCLSSDWVWQSSNGLEHVFSNGSKELRVDADLCLVVTGTAGAESIHLFSPNDSATALAGNDTIVLHDSLADGSGRISLSDLPAIDGGEGADLLRLSGSGLSLDLGGAGITDTLKGLEAIDISTSIPGAGNKLVLNDDLVPSGGSFSISGTGDDSLCLSSDWVWQSNSSGERIFVNGSKELRVDDQLRLVITGTAGVDSIDLFSSGDSVDALGGNDTIVLHDSLATGGLISLADLPQISGGSGEDQLVLQGSGLSLDLSGSLGTILGGLESIDITTSSPGTGNSLVFNDALPEDHVPFSVHGSGDDSLSLSSDWAWLKSENGAHHFTLGNKTLLVDEAMALVIVGTDNPDAIDLFATRDSTQAGDGNDTINLHESLAQGGVISLADLPLVKGGDGTDVLKVAGAGLTLNLAGTNPGTRLESIEAIDLSTATPGTGNLLLFNDALVPGGGSFSVSGTGDDSLSLSSAWTWQSTAGGEHLFVNGDKTLKVSTDLCLLMTGSSSGDRISVASSGGLIEALGGNDTIVLHDCLATGGIISLADLPEIRGGDGTDVLRLSGSGLNLDLSGADPGAVLKSIESIDIRTSMAGTGNTLRFNNALVPENGSLTITGTGDDTLVLSSDWICVNPTGSLYTFTRGTQTLNVSAEMRLAITGTDGNDLIHVVSPGGSVEALDGNDTICLHESLADNGVISLADLPAVSGGIGTDELKLEGAGLTLDLSGTGVSKLGSLECINISTSAPGSGNNLIFNDDLVAANDTLRISGTGEDSISLSSSWRYTGSNNGDLLFSNGSKHLAIAADICLNMSGTGGNDLISVASPGGSVEAGAGDDIILLHACLADNGLIRLADLPVINGDSGTDQLKLSGAGLSLDLSGADPNSKLIALEGIDISTATPGSGNSLIFNDLLVPDNGSFSISGTGDDSLSLSSAWQYQSSAGTEHIFTSGLKELRVSKDICLVFSGTSGDDAVDALSSGGSIHTLGGNDTISLHASLATAGRIGFEDLPLIDGGNGTDLLKLAGAGLTLDFSGTVPPDRLLGIEAIDISTATPGSGNSLLLNDALIPESGALNIIGSADDSISLSSAWQFQSSENGVRGYTNGSKVLTVSEAVQRTISGTDSDDLIRAVSSSERIEAGSGDDTISLQESLANSGLITLADLPTILGGSGTDTLKVDASGLILDLGGANPGDKLSGIETIDLGGSLPGMGNTLRMNQDCIPANGTLSVTGNADDRLDLSATALSYDSSDSQWHYYKDGTQTLRVSKNIGLLMDHSAESLGGIIELHTSQEILLAGSGNDSIRLFGSLADGAGLIEAAALPGIDGGNGTDSLQLMDAIDLDLRGLSGPGRISHIEGIDLTASPGQANSLYLNAAALNAMGNTSLNLLMEDEDSLFLEGAWSFNSLTNAYEFEQSGTTLSILPGNNDGLVNISAGYSNVSVFNGGDANEYIDAGTGSQKSIFSGGGNDSILLKDAVGGDNLINSNDYAQLDGGTGSNSLFLDAGLRLDLDDLLTHNVISNIQRIDLGANSELSLNAHNLDNLLPLGQRLLLSGQADAEVALSGSFAKGAQETIDGQVYDLYTNTDNTQELLVLNVLTVTGV